MADRNEPGPSFDLENVEIFFHSLFCLLCYKLYGTAIEKNILRLVLTNHKLHVSAEIYRLNIHCGIISTISKDTANFLKMNPLQLQPKSSKCMWWRKSMEIQSETISAETTAILEEKIILSFLHRLSEKLETNVEMLKICIDNILTSVNEIVLDFDFDKLASCSAKTEEDIVATIRLLSWIPKTNEERETISLIYKKKGWLISIDKNCIMPFNTLPFFLNGCFNIAKGKLFDKCIHVIENSATQLTSWYEKSRVATTSDDADETDSFQQFRIKLAEKKIHNAFVTINDWQPRMLNYHFAHFVQKNFESKHKYIREYIFTLNVLTHPIARSYYEAPYILRSLHPLTQQHIFHMVYKTSPTEQPTYEKLFQLFLLLRNVLLKLNITRLAMPKIGCSCGPFKFSTIFKMIKYVFQHHDIEIVIWKRSRSWICYFCKTDYDLEEQEAMIESYRVLYEADQEESEDSSH